ncbi:TPA: hypothetical protein U1729_001284 [Streptococcus suis]|nr:hypothetical protein [Streptococcus suis]HEM5651182.1 hypothetical protein [Streptococcus suis]
MKIKAIYRDDLTETYAILTAAQTLDVLFSRCGDEGIDVCGDAFGGSFYINEDQSIEFFRNNTLVEFEDFYNRLNALQECNYTDVTNHFEMVTE